MSDRYHVFLAQPNAGIITPQCVASMNIMTSKHKVSTAINQFGDVQHNFNMLWCAALNARKDMKFTHFGMIHSDIQVSTPNWVDVLIDEMDRVNADVMSAIMAIKDTRGLTTTGIRYPGVWATRRLTMREIMKLPETFSIADTEAPDSILAFSAGCWVCRLPLDGWPDRFPGFHAKYKIEIEDGQFMPWFLSEEWLASDWFHEQGLKVFATRKVNIGHLGAFLYPNDQAYGDWETDFQAPPKPEKPVVFFDEPHHKPSRRKRKTA